MSDTETLTVEETAGLHLMLEHLSLELRLATQAALLADAVAQEAIEILLEVCRPYRSRVRTESGEIRLAANGLCDRMRLRFLRIPAWEAALGKGVVMLQQRGEKVYLRVVPRAPFKQLPELCAVEAKASGCEITYELEHLPYAAPFAHPPLNQGPSGLFRVVGLNLDTMVYEGAKLKLRYRPASTKSDKMPDEATTPTLDLSVPHQLKTTKPARAIPEREELLNHFRQLVQAFEANMPIGPSLYNLLSGSGADYLRPSHGIHIREMLAEVQRSGSWESEQLHLLFNGKSWLDNPWIDIASFVPKGRG